MQERGLDMNSTQSQINSFNRSNSQQEKQDNNGSRAKAPSSSFNTTPRSSHQCSSANISLGNYNPRRPYNSHALSNRDGISPPSQSTPFPPNRKPTFNNTPRSGLKTKSQKDIENISQNRKTSFGSEKWSFKEKLYTKEQYMMANCTFLVDQSYDLMSHDYDPDLTVDWSAVHVVYQMVPLHQLPMCPICMDVPRCARVAPCGHQYCWPCAVRYVRYIDWESVRDEATANNLLRRTPTSKRCAICTDQLHIGQLKCVVTCAVSTFGVSDEITMKLMRRQKGSTLAVPADTNLSNDSHRAKVRRITPCESKELYQQDLVAIQSLHREAILESAADMANVCQDLYNEVYQRLSTLEIIECCTRLSETGLKSSESKTSNVDSPVPSSSSFCAIRYVDAFEGEVDTTPQETVEPPRISTDESSSSLVEEESGVSEQVIEEPDAEFFYQSDDGQHIYLHSLNWSCISREYGPPQNWPRQFSAKILEIDHAVVDTALRKRYRYLCHLPLLCPIQFVEVKLTPPLISEATLLFHKNGLGRREAARVKRERWEKEQDALIAQQQAQQQAELIERQSRNVYAKKSFDLAFDENDFVPLNVTTSEMASPTSSGPVSTSVSFAHVASRPPTVPQGVWGAPRNRQVSLSSTTAGTRKQSSSSDVSDKEETLQEYCPPEKGFFSRCSASDFVVKQAKQKKKK